MKPRHRGAFVFVTLSLRVTGLARRLAGVTRSVLAHRHLPAVLALGAIVMMLPALKTGLMMDDLVQRMVELKPAQLPPRIHETGSPADSGQLGTVLCDLFGLSRDRECFARARDYGTLPWWVSDNTKAALWRPVTAFTHWLDYRLFPDSPALMHAHNIAWFAAVVFLLTVICRKLMATAWVAGLAALLFLLDSNTYFPVMMVANRGFVMSLFFGLLCLYQHHRWRSTKARRPFLLSMLFLALSLLANEGGASTFAFILAYALVLEPGPLRTRALTVLPAVLVIVVWRGVYQALGFGVVNVGGYIDPANEPLLFVREVIPRTMALLGGQLTGMTPDFLIAVNPDLRRTAFALYCGSVLATLIVFLPLLRRDRIAAFWLAVMVLAAIPAATVVPLSKNLGFVAVGAFGLIACFVAGLVTRQGGVPERPAHKTLAWLVCGLLVLAHVPGALAARIGAVAAAPFVLRSLNRLGDIGEVRDPEGQDVVVVNAPTILAMAVAPAFRAYHGQGLPRTLRTLVPGCTDFEVSRADERTLVIRPKAPDSFSCGDLGPLHFAYAFSAVNLMAVREFKAGDRQVLNGLTVEILEVSRRGLPVRVRYRFDTSLNSPGFHWLRFDWAAFSYRPFQVPVIGQSVSLEGPHRVTLATAVRRILGPKAASD